MIPLTVAQVLSATAAELVGTTQPDGHAVLVDGPVVTDSRQVGPGSLFVARMGETTDGHEFVARAAAAGAVAALVEHEVADAGGLQQLLVADSELAFGQVARAVIEAGKPDLRVIGITGSSGKTSTKDLLAQVLATHAPTVAAPESFNSEIGVPITVCLATPDTRHLVVEMGARGIGHVRYLAGIAPPDIAVVLNVGYAHAGEFGSIEAVEQAKGELVEATVADGVVVLNADDPRVARMASRSSARVVTFSADGAADAVVRAEDIALDDAGRASFRLVIGDASAGSAGAPVTLQLHGRHHVGNALAVAAVAAACGMDIPAIAAALGTARPASRWRMEVTERADGVTVVNDAYNANPDSMAAALRALAAMSRGGTRRTWAALGQMLELGDESEALHAQVGALAAELGIDQVVAVGSGASPIADGAGAGRATRVADVDAAFALLHGQLAPGDVVLFKSSRDSGLRWLGERVAADAATAPSTDGATR